MQITLLLHTVVLAIGCWCNLGCQNPNLRPVWDRVASGHVWIHTHKTVVINQLQCTLFLIPSNILFTPTSHHPPPGEPWFLHGPVLFVHVQPNVCVRTRMSVFLPLPLSFRRSLWRCSIHTQTKNCDLLQTCSPVWVCSAIRGHYDAELFTTVWIIQQGRSLIHWGRDVPICRLPPVLTWASVWNPLTEG